MAEDKKKKRKITPKDRKRRRDQIIEAGIKQNALVREQKEAEELALSKEMPLKHKAFIDLYVWGDSQHQGNAAACYSKVFNDTNMAQCSTNGRKLLKRDHVSTYLAEQISGFEDLIKIEKIKNINTLTKIRDEMATAKYTNRFGEINGVPACRSVSIKAAETVNKMMGFDKPKEINVNHGSNEQGVVFNLIVPPTVSPESRDITIDITPHEDL